ncbi:MAG TPA: hypothetical protein IAC33_09510 [Candidatus Fimousia stercorigallinarum]|nr:hypothetical protein [Candidatus Fimousia stercorigallinarum]
MVEYIVLGIIIVIILVVVIFFLLSSGKKSGRASEKRNKTGNGNVPDDDLQAMRDFLKSLEEEQQQGETKAFSKRSEDRKSQVTKEEDPEEIKTASGETSYGQEEEEPEQEEVEDTKPFQWPSEEEEELKETEGEPVLDYRIIIDGRVSVGSIRTQKEEYLIGKDKDTDLVLETDDAVVGKKFLRVRVLNEKELFVLEAVRKDWVLAVWSEEKGEWEPRDGQIVFGIEDRIVIALTQFKKRTEKNISRLELAMPGYLGEEEAEEAVPDFLDGLDDDEGMFDI